MSNLINPAQDTSRNKLLIPVSSNLTGATRLLFRGWRTRTPSNMWWLAIIVYASSTALCRLDVFLNKWKCCKMKHKYDYKTKNDVKLKKNHYTGIRTQHATNELQWQSVRLLLRAVMNRHNTYIYISIFSMPANRVYSHCVGDHCVAIHTTSWAYFFSLRFQLV